MGIDLKILIVDGRMGTNAGYSHSMMEVGRDYDFHDRVRKFARTIPGFVLSGYLARIPDGSWKDERGYGDITETPYGEPLTYVSAGEYVRAVLQSVDRPGTVFARAAYEYVKALPADTWIGLYWH